MLAVVFCLINLHLIPLQNWQVCIIHLSHVLGNIIVREGVLNGEEQLFITYRAIGLGNYCNLMERRWAVYNASISYDSTFQEQKHPRRSLTQIHKFLHGHLEYCVLSSGSFHPCCPKKRDEEVLKHRLDKSYRTRTNTPAQLVWFLSFSGRKNQLHWKVVQALERNMQVNQTGFVYLWAFQPCSCWRWVSDPKRHNTQICALLHSSYLSGH